ncbi:MAG: hypothetical protein MUQ00_04480 [Candidatus Aminicenantes bacterium]|nr:hypothetical protein [Candidatus Aminicenantes bacterium]
MENVKMKRICIIVSVLFLGVCSSALADNYAKIRTKDANSQNLNEWKEASGILEVIEKSEGRIYIGGDKKKVTLMRNLQTSKLIGSDAWGNLYGVVGNSRNCGKVIDTLKEVAKNVKMTEKREGRVNIGEDAKVVTLMRDMQTGKLIGRDAWGNLYGVVGNTSPTGKIIDPYKETIENVEIIALKENEITRNGKKVMLTRNKLTGKLSGSDAWGNCYGVAGNTSPNGKIIDPSKEIIANVTMLE